jgi:hypothetical protein
VQPNGCGVQVFGRVVRHRLISAQIESERAVRMSQGDGERCGRVVWTGRFLVFNHPNRIPQGRKTPP